jgi:hypothetical protein
MKTNFKNFGQFFGPFCTKSAKIRPQVCLADLLFILPLLNYAANNRPVGNGVRRRFGSEAKNKIEAKILFCLEVKKMYFCLSFHPFLNPLSKYFLPSCSQACLSVCLSILYPSL